MIINADLFLIFTSHSKIYRPTSLKIKVANLNIMLNFKTMLKKYSKL